MSLDEIIRESVTSKRFKLFDFEGIIINARFTLDGVVVESFLEKETQHLFTPKFREEVTKELFFTPIEALDLSQSRINIKYSGYFTFVANMEGSIPSEILRMQNEIESSFNVKKESKNNSVKLKLKNHSALIKEDEAFISNGEFSLILDFDSLSKIYYEFRKLRNK